MPPKKKTPANAAKTSTRPTRASSRAQVATSAAAPTSKIAPKRTRDVASSDEDVPAAKKAKADDTDKTADEPKKMVLLKFLRVAWSSNWDIGPRLPF